jgi:hypothetical protein
MTWRQQIGEKEPIIITKVNAQDSTVKLNVQIAGLDQDCDPEQLERLSRQFRTELLEFQDVDSQGRADSGPGPCRFAVAVRVPGTGPRILLQRCYNRESYRRRGAGRWYHRSPAARRASHPPR